MSTLRCGDSRLDLSIIFKNVCIWSCQYPRATAHTNNIKNYFVERQERVNTCEASYELKNERILSLSSNQWTLNTLNYLLQQRESRLGSQFLLQDQHIWLQQARRSLSTKTYTLASNLLPAHWLSLSLCLSVLAELGKLQPDPL